MKETINFVQTMHMLILLKVPRKVIARAAAQDQTAAGQAIETRRRLREQERVSIGNDREIRQNLDPLCRCGGERERDERIEGVVAAGGEPVVAGKSNPSSTPSPPDPTPTTLETANLMTDRG